MGNPVYKMSDQYDLFGGSVPRVSGSRTSAEAADSMAEHVNGIAAVVLSAIRQSGVRGMTCDQLEMELGLRHQTASARVRELFLRNAITSTSIRKTRSGRSAQVWVAR